MWDNTGENIRGTKSSKKEADIKKIERVQKTSETRKEKERDVIWLVHRVSTGQGWRKGRGPRSGRHNASWEVCMGSNGSKERHGAPRSYGGAVSIRPNPHRCSVNVETFGYVIQRRLHRDYYAPSIVKISLACGHLASRRSLVPREDNTTSIRFLREVFCYWKMMLI